MASQMDRRRMAARLLAHDFERLAGKATGHWQFAHKGTGVRVTLIGHGPPDLTKKHMGMILRQLDRAGFDREAVRRDLFPR